MSEKNNLAEHSAVKVELLHTYLTIYLGIIGNLKYIEAIHVFDMYCNQGFFENGREGSPVQILKSVKDFFYTMKSRNMIPPPINCFFNDIDKNKIKHLENGVKAKPSLHDDDYGKRLYSTLDYNDFLVRIQDKVSKMKNEKAFVFIDPYDYKTVKVEHIVKLLANNNTEVLLWQPIQFMYRFKENPPAALQGFIDELDLDISNIKSAKDFVIKLKEGFQRHVGTYYVDSFTIQKSANTVFSLFFFTPSIKGFEKMLEAKWKIDSENGDGWNYMKHTSTLFHNEKMNPLEEALGKYLYHSSKTNQEIYEFTLRQGFLTKHTVEIFINWQNNGRLDVKLADGSDARKRAFYLKHEEYKASSPKVTITLKR